jgi:fatty-acyl-CoA synthase
MYAPAVIEQSVGEALLDAAAAAPQLAAVIHPDSGRRLSYLDLAEESERVAAALLARFRPGEAVAVWLPNVPEFLMLQFGAALAGMVLVPVPMGLRTRDLAHILRASHAAGIFLTAEYRGTSASALLDEVRAQAPELREAVSLNEWADFLAAGPPDVRLPTVRPDQPSQIQFTSGSTGPPKGAVLHHRGVLNTSRFVVADLGLTAEDVFLACLPLSYIAGCTITVLAALQARASLVLCDFEPKRVLSLIESERASVTLLAVAMLQMLVDHEDFAAHDISSLRAASIGGSTIPPGLAARAEAALGAPLTVMYGLTEACGMVSQTRLDDDRSDRTGTIGRPHPHVEAKISPAGELLLRGYFVMDGYLDLPAATRQAIDSDGWLHTGDLATMDERGYLRIIGRLKEIINRGGRKIAPGEIEALLQTHPAVALGAVIGVADERLGEEIAAFVQPVPGAKLKQEELVALCTDQLAPFKRPRHWFFVDQLPLTRSGKVHKPSLREAVAQHNLPGSTT